MDNKQQQWQNYKQTKTTTVYHKFGVSSEETLLTLSLGF